MAQVIDRVAEAVEKYGLKVSGADLASVLWIIGEPYEEPSGILGPTLATGGPTQKGMGGSVHHLYGTTGYAARSHFPRWALPCLLRAPVRPHFIACYVSPILLTRRRVWLIDSRSAVSLRGCGRPIR